jgi:8-oxo-dGTP pyrophosphatase MutT (NUDIX family)
VTDSPSELEQACVEAYIFAGRPPRILLFRRPPRRGSVWAPVSGKVEPEDEDLVAALRRELTEETQFSDPVRVFELGWEFAFTGPDGRPWRLHGFGVELEREAKPILSDEHDAFEWMDPLDALGRLHYEDNRQALTLLLELLEREDRGARRSDLDAGAG